jgi:hypothetical protein
LATLFCPQNIREVPRISTRGVRRGGCGGNLDRLSRFLNSATVDAPSHEHECLGRRPWPWTFNPELDRKAASLACGYGDSGQTCQLGPGKYTVGGFFIPLRLYRNPSNSRINSSRTVLNRVDCNHQCNQRPVFPTHISSISGFCLSCGFRVPELPGA